MAPKHTIQQLLARKANVRPSELHAVLVAAGFTRRYGKGDHWVYTHPLRDTPLVIDPRRPTLKIVYVVNAARAIEEVQNP